MSCIPHTPNPDPEPNAADQAAIDAEWPLIAAELEGLDAEITILPTTRLTAVGWWRLRRAETGIIRAFLDTHPTTPTTGVESVGDVAARPRCTTPTPPLNISVR